MEGFCRGCLVRYEDPMEMLQYSEKYRRLFVYSTGIQVKRNDTIAFQICKDCFLNMKASCKFKKLCRGSDKKFKSYLALKDVDSGVDFCTFLRNSDDTMAFRLPLMSGNSTPVNENKSRDDDNDSTCTSIRNFMTDMLQGEEMPDTEARIIREVIEEEADVLDDSLDSHWLEDDVSIDTDFRLDFSISPFATPHSVNNDHCYTPKRLGDPKEEQLKKYFTSISPARHHRHVNDFTDMIRNNQSEKELCTFGTEEIESEIPGNFDMPLLENENAVHHLDLQNINNEKDIDDADLPVINNQKTVNNFNLAIIDNEKSINNLNLSTIEEEKSLNNLDLSSLPSLDGNEKYIVDNEKSIKNLNVPIIEEEKSLNSLDLSSLPSLDGNEKYMNSLDLSFGSEKSLNNLDLPSLPSIDNEKSTNNLDLPSVDNDGANYNQEVHTPNFYVPTDGTSYITASKEIERLIDAKKLDKDKPCTIDKNLEKALENEDNKEFSLDDLLVSPRVYHVASGASTPTIANILFGEKVNLHKTLDPEYIEEKYKIETLVYEEFVQDEPLELHTVNKNEIADIKDEVPMDVDEADGETKQAKEFVETQFDLETFFCKTCDKQFKSFKAIKIHAMNKHKIKTRELKRARDEVDTGAQQKVKKVKLTTELTGELFDLENFICNICDKTFEHSKAVYAHAINIHSFKIIKPKRHKVVEVDTGTKETVEELPSTNETDENYFDIDTFFCKLCSAKFHSSKAIILHAWKKHEIKIKKPKPIKVPEADTETKHTFEKLKLSTDFDEKQFDLENFFCNICNKKFDSSKAISLHSVKAHNIKIIKPKSFAYKFQPRVCSFCGKLYRNLQSYHVHLKKHKKSKPEPGLFKCDHCHLEFTMKSKIEKHILSHGGMNVKKKPGKYVCTDCGATSTTIGNFRLHQRRHTKNYLYKCEECGKGFYRLSDYTVHMRLHTGEKPFQCTFCDNTYSRKDALTKHVKLHINDRPYKCEHCPSAFAAKSQLNKHMKVAKLCKKRRGINTDTIVDKKEADLKTEKMTDAPDIQHFDYQPHQSLSVLNESPDEGENDVVGDKVQISSQLPYIDTEMSN